MPSFEEIQIVLAEGFLLWLRRRIIFYFGQNNTRAVSSARQLEISSEDPLAGEQKGQSQVLFHHQRSPFPGFPLQEIAPRQRSPQVMCTCMCLRSLLTVRLKLLPSLPVCLFLFAPSSFPSSCLCSRSAPSWAATSRGQRLLWGRSSWVICLK